MALLAKNKTMNCKPRNRLMGRLPHRDQCCLSGKA
jgi:hypothetical protein